MQLRSLRAFLAVALFIGGFSVAFGQREEPVSSSITRATVFLAHAQVWRTATARVAAGHTDLTLTGLTAQLDTESIQAQAVGKGVTLLGVRHRQNHLQEGAMSPTTKALRDSIADTEARLTAAQGRLTVVNKEERALMANKKIGGKEKTLTVVELRTALEFFRARLGELAVGRATQESLIKKLNERLTRLNEQLNGELELHRNAGEIVASVWADAPVAVELEVSYITRNAGWRPLYSLRATNAKSPLQLVYRAEVYQRTGEAWDNTRLRLSSANAAQYGLKPELSPWRIDFDIPPQPLAERRMSMMKAVAPAHAEETADLATSEAAQYASIEQSQLSVDFDLAAPYTISSSAAPTIVEIGRHEMAAQYRYAATPKLDTETFLLARVTGWEKLGLLPGEAGVFFEGMFVGKTLIDPRAIRDTLTLSLGRDKRVIVQREELKDVSSRNWTGAAKKELRAYAISVRNTRDESIYITVEDQIPIAGNTQIEITARELGGAILNRENGKLEWPLELAPRETRTLHYQFEVRYPKDKTVNGL